MAALDKIRVLLQEREHMRSLVSKRSRHLLRAAPDVKSANAVAEQITSFVCEPLGIEPKHWPSPLVFGESVARWIEKPWRTPLADMNPDSWAAGVLERVIVLCSPQIDGEISRLLTEADSYAAA